MREANRSILTTALASVGAAVGFGLFGYGARRRVQGVRRQQDKQLLATLRERLDRQGAIPDLGPGWNMETVLRAAHGDAFSGDFVVAGRRGSLVDVVLCDVTGKGRAAAADALQLSGAISGITQAVQEPGFLPATNRYVLSANWADRFASAVHATLNLDSGDFRVRSAGHPPGVRYCAASHTWAVLESETGPVLGVLDEATFPALMGRLEPGDALLFYTDGLVEVPGQDLGEGIRRLAGQAAQEAAVGFAGAAARIADQAPGGSADDCGVVLIWRSPG